MKKNCYLVLMILFLGVYAAPLPAKDIPRSATYLMADEYHQYLSDVYLLKSKLILEPGHPIAYDDPDSGQLVKSVFDKDRSRSALKIYLDGLSKNQGHEKLDVLLLPIAGLYIDSFATFGTRYEDEYLDAIQVTVIFLQEEIKFRQTIAKNKLASGDEAKVFMSLLTSAEKNLDWKKKDFSDALRMQVTQHKFTESGAQRALKMAQDLEQ